MNRKVYIQIEIPKRAIQDRDTRPFLRRLEKWQLEYRKSTNGSNFDINLILRGGVIIFIQGYNNDPRELFEIEEVRNWFKALLEDVPYLFYYINPEPSFYQYFLLLSMYIPYTKVNDGVVLDKQALERFIETQRKKGSRKKGSGLRLTLAQN